MPLGAARLNGISRFFTTGRTASTWTANGNTISTAQTKIGTASLLADGTGTDAAYSTNAPNIGSGDFTIEFWIYPKSNTNGTSLNGTINKRDLSTSGTGTWGTAWTDISSNRKVVWYNLQTVVAIETTANHFSYNAWSHWAFVRSGSTLKIYIDGTERASGTDSTNFTNTQNTVLSYWGDGHTTIDAHIDELRVSNTARYTAGFTAPTTAFTNDANTLYLLHFDGTNGSTTITDDNA